MANEAPDAGAAGTVQIGDQTVNRLGFGAMRLTGERRLGPPRDVDEARRVLGRAVEFGVDFVDTADSYGPGASERLVGEALADDDVLVATKGGFLRNPDSDWIRHADPDYLVDAVLKSLDRLDVDRIDCYQLHRPDPDVPLEDSLAALAECQDRGLIRHLGVSGVTVEELDRAREQVDVVSVQNAYNVADRSEAPVLEACEDAGIAFIPYFPLAAGNVAERAPALEEVAEARDATAYQVALAWLLQRSPVTLPIPGTSSLSHLEENVAAAALELTDEEMARLNGGYPGGHAGRRSCAVSRGSRAVGAGRSARGRGRPPPASRPRRRGSPG